MLQSFYRKFLKRKNRRLEIAPDEIFIDASNLPQFDTARFEGRIERPIPQKTIFISGIVFLLIGLVFASRLWVLQVRDGEAYAEKAIDNRLRHVTLFAERGLIKDRNGALLVWNTPSTDHPEFPSRQYATSTGLAQVLGFISYPAKDKSGIYYSTEFVPHDGVEETYNALLSGKPGTAIIEMNAVGQVNSESTVDFPVSGAALSLSIDSRIQDELYQKMKALATQVGFTGGAAIIMDVETGEILALVNYPEYDPNVLTEGKDAKKIASYSSDASKPFLDRAVDGLYTPGSIVKPYVAIAALNEGVIDPLKKILSTGSISIPNPYDKTKPSVFNDWRPQGWIDMRAALAVSSDVYFYEIGGGFQDQKGLGIANIKKYLQEFGFGAPVPGDFSSSKAGVIPDPEWKAAVFDGDPWRLGDTYNTSIGQYGVQVTPLQAVRATAAIANNGKLLTPTILLNGNQGRPYSEALSIPAKYFTIVQEGMRQGVTDPTATDYGLNMPEVAIAAKTGTAELGVSKAYVNSWVTGFFPYGHPRYAFAAVMEHGPRANTLGALYVMRGLFDWMKANTPDYLK